MIVELPKDADGWSVGDEVLGSGADFTHATVFDVPLANLVARPSSIDWAVAGTLPAWPRTR